MLIGLVIIIGIISGLLGWEEVAWLVVLYLCAMWFLAWLCRDRREELENTSDYDEYDELEQFIVSANN